MTESVVITALERTFLTFRGRTKHLISIALFWKGHWGRGRLPWEKEVGEIPQGAARGSSPVPPQESAQMRRGPGRHDMHKQKNQKGCAFPYR
jgi:hypothetical protein